MICQSIIKIKKLKVLPEYNYFIRRKVDKVISIDFGAHKNQKHFIFISINLSSSITTSKNNKNKNFFGRMTTKEKLLGKILK